MTYVTPFANLSTFCRGTWIVVAFVFGDIKNVSTEAGRNIQAMI